MTPAVVFDSIQRAEDVVRACTVATGRAAHAAPLQHAGARLYALTCEQCIKLARDVGGGIERGIDVEKWYEGKLSWRP